MRSQARFPTASRRALSADIELLLEELAHIAQFRNAARGEVPDHAPRDPGGLETEAARAVEAALAGTRFEIEGAASAELHETDVVASGETTQGEWESETSELTLVGSMGVGRGPRWLEAEALAEHLAALSPDEREEFRQSSHQKKYEVLPISSHPGLPDNRIVVPVAWIEKHWTEVAEARRKEFPAKINELSQDIDRNALSARRLRWFDLIPQAADGLFVGVWMRPESGVPTLVLVEMRDVIADVPEATRLRLLDEYVSFYGETDAEEDDYIRGRLRNQLNRTSSTITEVTQRIVVHAVDQTHFAELMGRERTQDIVPTTGMEAASLAAEMFIYLTAEDDVGKAREAQYATP